MYKVKIISMGTLPEYHWIRKRHKVGDILDLNDHIYISSSRKAKLKVIEHYKRVTLSKKKCPHCGNMVIQRGKLTLPK